MFTASSSPWRRAGLIATAVVAVGVLAGCSGGGTPAEPGGNTDAPAAEEIVLGTLQPISSTVYSNPYIQAGIEAAIASVNANGGLDGHPLRLEACDTSFDANKELSCARELVDGGVSAILTPMVMVDQTGRAHLYAETNGVPMIGARGIVLADLQSPVSFPATPGQLGWGYGVVANLISSGAENITIFADDNAASTYTIDVYNAALEVAGKEAKAVVVADVNADPTYDVSAARVVSSGADGVALTIAPANYPKAVLALRNAGFDGAISNMSSLATPENVDAMGDDGNGILLASHFDAITNADNPAIAKFLADMEEFAPADTRLDESALSGWNSVQMFVQAMEGADAFDAAAVLSAFENLSEPIDTGVIPPYSVKGYTSPVDEQPRMFNPYVITLKIQDSEILSTGDWLNPFVG